MTAATDLRPTRLMLVEDDARLARRLRDEMQRAGFECGWAASAEAGAQRIADEKPDLVLLDLNLPGRSGLDLLTDLREHSQVPVIVLTARLHGEDKVRALDLGADDYVTKPFWHQELCARIRAVVRRKAPWQRPSEVLTAGPVVLDRGSHSVTVDGEPVPLTRTEFDLLAYLAGRQGRAVHREHLISTVLPGEDSDVEALQKHMSRLRRKLGTAGHCVKTVRGVGYRLEVDA